MSEAIVKQAPARGADTSRNDQANVIGVIVNGARAEIAASDADTPLLWVLREHLGLKGTKFGCGQGTCGACTVQIDGEAKPSCKVTVREVANRSITTIEGLAARRDHPVIRAWLAEQVPQCGYCQPGMIMAAAALLEHTAAPTDADIDAALSPVLCRCGTYQRARQATHRAAQGRFADAPFPAESLKVPEAATGALAVAFNPFVKIAADGTVIVVIGRSEMGQGVTTSLPMLVAEELEVPLSRMRTEFAPASHVYDNPVIGEQITVGSMSMKFAWRAQRRAGAEVRERLVAAAAKTWGVARRTCKAQDGAVMHGPSGRRLDYRELAAKAARLPVPRRVRLKKIEDFRLLGKPTARLDLPSHVCGRTLFGTDVTVPGMLAATIVMPPVFGAKAATIDSANAKAIPGVRDIIKISDGVAIVADDIWSALRGREALRVEWRGGDTIGLSNATIFQELRQAAQRKGAVERNVGRIAPALENAATIIEADYETPFLAHAPIEPINCTAMVTGKRCDIWVPTQAQTIAQKAAARAAGLPVKAVNVHSTFLGGGFGRRSVPDMVTQAVEIAKQIKQPVQLLWTREDDLRHDHYRPASFTSLKGGLDAKGRPVAWLQRIAGPEFALWDIEIPYDIPSLRVECIEKDAGIPTGYWRSVGASQNAFAIEGFIDELAHAAGADPVAFRLKLLASSPRHRGVLELAADKAGWDKPVAPGRARGVAVYFGHGGWVAQIAEVSVAADRTLKVHRIVCAADCGFVINPDTAAAQVEGGIVFGLSAALTSAITIEDGRVVEGSFRDYPLLTIADMPSIEVHIVESRADPSGAGECGVPPVAPAVANAVFAATGIRVRSLPIRRALLAA
jgi:isoquinoline 1-oxidoreductase beta subunit